MKITAVACAIALMAPCAIAWNDTGHRAIAFLAYSHLKPKARERIAAILRAHPDFASILSRGASTAAFDVDRNAFVTAATWPDLIKGDQRFSEKPAGPALPGFPDMARHTKWHFINVPVPEAFRSQPVDSDNGVTQLPVLLSMLHKSGAVTAEEAYALPWILHIIGDLHQPLHTVARFATVNGRTDHDKGGNVCYVSGANNLHSLWDGILGRDNSEGGVARLAASLGDEHPKPANVSRNPGIWVNEGVAGATTHAYALSAPCQDKSAPAALPNGYVTDAVTFARSRAALAAYRLAAILNKTLGG